MRILYPLIASALITIVPFLLTFEKGQDIIRGLFGYEYFALLLLIVFVKNKLSKIVLHPFTSLRGKEPATSVACWKQSLYAITLIILFIALFAIAWIDLQNLLAIKGWETSWYGILPFMTCGLAAATTWKSKPFSFNGICFILFVALILHLACYNHYAAQPLAQFPTIDYLARIAPKPVQRTEISDEYRNKYIVTDSVTITRDYIDTTRNNVIILVESWGVPLDIKRFEEQLKFFEGVQYTAGIHNRMYSRTRTAEREDLIFKIERDSTGRRDTTFLPEVFIEKRYKTTFLFGGDSLEQWRYKYIRNIGFIESFYGNNFNDSTMVYKIDNILADTTQRHFIAWTTRDTRFPIVSLTEIYNSNVNKIDSVYSFRLNHNLSLISDLVQRNPNTRFIIQGDHNPILSPVSFQEKFYNRWEPFIILN